MRLVDDTWYYLPDGQLVQAQAVGAAPDWYLLTDPSGVTCYGVYASGWRQFVYDQELGDYHGIACPLTLADLRPAESNAIAHWQARTAAVRVRAVQARTRTRL